MLRLAAAIALVSASAALAASAPRPSGAQAIDSRLAKARSEAKRADAEALRLEKAAAKALADAKDIGARHIASAQALAAAEARISAADARLRLINAGIARQRQKLAAQQAPASALLSGLVLSARRPPLLLVAGGRSAEELVKLRILVEAAAPVVQARTAALVRELDRQAQLERRAAAARQDLLESRHLLEGRRRAFAELEAEAVALAEARGSEALGAGDAALVRQERLATIERGAASGRAAARLARELAELGPAPFSRKGRRVPSPQLRYQLPATAPVSEGFGSVSSTGVRSRGLTLATRRGDPVHSPAGGVILFAGAFRDYDGVIILDHGNGWRSVLVNAGSALEKGEKVGLGKEIGVALGPLEVQLYKDGRPVSPALIAGSSAMLSNPRQSG